MDARHQRADFCRIGKDAMDEFASAAKAVARIAHVLACLRVDCGMVGLEVGEGAQIDERRRVLVARHGAARRQERSERAVGADLQQVQAVAAEPAGGVKQPFRRIAGCVGGKQGGGILLIRLAEARRDVHEAGTDALQRQDADESAPIAERDDQRLEGLPVREMVVPDRAAPVERLEDPGGVGRRL
jgi:hypothetical protein